MEILTDIPVELPIEAVLKHLHVEPGSSDARLVLDLLDSVKARMNPKAIYDVRYITGKTENTVRVDEIDFESRVLRVNLDEVHRVFPCVATCGSELEDLSGASGDPMERYWIEEIKALLLRGAMTHMRRDLETKYRPGKTSAMAPGSLEDWPISEQKKLFALFGDVEALIGVRLTDSFLMVPIKSLSGIIFPTRVGFESCQLCPREVCVGRRAPYDEHLWQKYRSAEQD